MSDEKLLDARLTYFVYKCEKKFDGLDVEEADEFYTKLEKALNIIHKKLLT
jgi:hypothetical protein